MTGTKHREDLEQRLVEAMLEARPQENSDPSIAAAIRYFEKHFGMSFLDDSARVVVPNFLKSLPDDFQSDGLSEALGAHVGALRNAVTGVAVAYGEAEGLGEFALATALQNAGENDVVTMYNVKVLLEVPRSQEASEKYAALDCETKVSRMASASGASLGAA